MDITEITVIAQAVEARRRQNSPRTKQQLNNAVLVGCALPIAAVYESAMQRNLIESPEDIKNRLVFLLENDAIFRYAVDSAVANVMRSFEDYARATGLDLR